MNVDVSGVSLEVILMWYFLALQLILMTYLNIAFFLYNDLVIYSDYLRSNYGYFIYYRYGGKLAYLYLRG